MSSIFGFIENGRETDDELRERREKAIRFANDGYGAACGTASGDNWFVGSFIEHFSGRYPAGAPVLRRDGKLWLTDAVIYNREELTEEADGDISDEELLTGLISRSGFAALAGVNGDFAGAVYDPESGEVTLYRDHTGIRPLFYYLDEKQFAFSTDQRGLGALPDADLTMDDEMIWLRLAGHNRSTLDRTEILRIRCVLPGSIMTVKTREGFEVSAERYWKPGQKKIRLKNDEEYVREMRRLVEDAVRRRLDAFPGVIGAELSGGLDSSVIDIIINRFGREGKYISWRIVPDDWPLQPVDERKVIADVCAQEHISCEFTPEEHDFRIDDVSYPTFHNTDYLAKVSEIAAKAGARCVFSGQGGDEGVSHRPSVLELWHAGEYGAFIRELWWSLAGKKLRLLRFFRLFIRLLFTDYPKKKGVFSSVINVLPLLKEDYKRKMSYCTGAPLLFSLDPVAEFEYGGVRERPETAAYQSAPYGVRFVYPFQDHRVFDFAVSVPRELYLRRGVKRWLYRQAFDDLMPQSLREIDYKDFPSLRNGLPERKIPAERKTSREVLLPRLDRELWGGIVDFAAAEALPDRRTTDDEERIADTERQLAVLNQLFLVQKFLNIQKQ